MHIASDGLAMESPQALFLQLVPPVAHPHVFPAPSIAALQRANVFKLNDEQRIAL